MRKGWQPLLCSLALAVLITAPSAQGQINSSPNVVGSGARALGMGGAFIAVADDATAASWNPGGLAQLERPEASLVYSMKWFREDWTTTHYVRPWDSVFEVSPEDLNYLSIAYPFRRTLAGRNFVVSLNFQHQYDFDRTVDVGLWNTVFGNRQKWAIDYYQVGSLSTLSPAFGIELTEKLSVGLVANIWDTDLISSNHWKNKNHWHSHLLGGTVYHGDLVEEYDNVRATNYTLGLLYKPTYRLSIGAVYHTKLDMDVEYTSYSRNRVLPWLSWYNQRDVEIEFPSSLGVGVAYRFPNDKLTISFDVTRRDWGDFVLKDPYAGVVNRKVSYINRMPLWRTKIDPAYTVRFGAEYVFVDPKSPRQKYLPSLRAGLFYDPEGASGRKDTWWGTTQGDGDPDDYYGVTLGAGLLMNNRVNLDVAYQYRWGRDVRRDTLADRNNPFEQDFGVDVDQHSLYVSTVVYF